MIRVAAITTLLALFACADNQTVIIVRNIDPDDSCTVSPATDLSVPRGFLDVTPILPNGVINPGYLFTPEMRNITAAPAVTPSRPGNPNAHIFYLKGVDVRILAGPDSSSEAVVTALSAAGLASRTLRLGTAIEPNAQVALGFEVIDTPMLEAMEGAVVGQTQVVARVVAFGDMDGNDIETPPFDYPIVLCNGCLINDLGPCSLLPSSVDPQIGGACGPVQDGALDCCVSGTEAICPAVSTAM
jgi:hypothetical protein